MLDIIGRRQAAQRSALPARTVEIDACHGLEFLRLPGDCGRRNDCLLMLFSQRIPIAAMLAAVLASACLSCARNSGPAGLLSQVFGQVRLTRGAETAPAQAGAQLQANDAIETGPASGCEIVLHTGARLRLGPGARLQTLSDASKNASRLQLDRGAVSAEIARLSAGSDFSLRTPTTIAAVRGTRFLMRESSAGTLTALFDGKLLVADPGGRSIALDGPSELRLAQGDSLDGMQPSPLSAEAKALMESLATFPPIHAAPAPAAPPIPDRSAAGLEAPTPP